MADAMEHFIIGVNAFKTGEIDKAIKELEAATQADKKNHKAFAYLGAAYAAKDRYNAAIGAFKISEQLNPGVPSIHYNIAQAYEAAGSRTKPSSNMSGRCRSIRTTKEPPMPWPTQKEAETYLTRRDAKRFPVGGMHSLAYRANNMVDCRQFPA